jgi:hypothetical protein
MQWTPIAPAPAYSSLTEPLEKDRKRLEKMIEGVDKKRADADALDELEVDKGQDRSPLYHLRIQALEAEIEVRDGLIIWEFAWEQVSRKLVSEADAAIRDIELAVREELAIPDHVAVPPACLQVRREWWEARSKLAAVPSFVGHGNRPAHEQAIVSAKDAISKLTSGIGNEVARLEHAAKMRKLEVDARNRLYDQQESKIVARQEQEVRVAALVE